MMFVYYVQVFKRTVLMTCRLKQDSEPHNHASSHRMTNILVRQDNPQTSLCAVFFVTVFNRENVSVKSADSHDEKN